MLPEQLRIVNWGTDRCGLCGCRGEIAEMVCQFFYRFGRLLCIGLSSAWSNTSRAMRDSRIVSLDLLDAKSP